MIGTLATNKAGPHLVITGVMVSQSNLQRRINRFRTGIGEKDVVHMIRQNACNLAGSLETQRMSRIERRGIIQLFQRRINGIANFLATMTSRNTEQPCAAVQKATTFMVFVIHAICFHEQTR